MNDIHYSRFLKELAKSKEKPQDIEQFAPQPSFSTPQKEMLYSFNIDSLRRTSCYDNVPNSIIEREFERIRQPQRDFVTANRKHLKRQE